MRINNRLSTFCRQVCGCLSLLAGILPPHAIAQDPATAIEWEVEQRFRNFDFLGTKEDALRAWTAYSPRDSDATMIDWVARLNQEGLASPYAERKGAWREAERDLRRLFDPRLLDPPDHFYVRARITKHAGEDTLCSWVANGSPLAEAPCSVSVRLSIPATGARVTVSSNNALLVSGDIRPSFRRILGLATPMHRAKATQTALQNGSAVLKDNRGSRGGSRLRANLWEMQRTGSPHAAIAHSGRTST